jgi:AAA+ ATPase superfamily predicted ATPase
MIHDELQPGFFPSRVALGMNFCNRTAEKKRLKHNIEQTQHTLIVSPRRYGKTSLVAETLREAAVPHGSIHFFNAFRDEIVLKKFITSLSTSFLIVSTSCVLLPTIICHLSNQWLTRKGYRAIDPIAKQILAQ